MEDKVRKKLDLIQEALDDNKKGSITDLTTLIAISIITNDKKPSKECTEWAEKVFSK